MENAPVPDAGETPEPPTTVPRAAAARKPTAARKSPAKSPTTPRKPTAARTTTPRVRKPAPPRVKPAVVKPAVVKPAVVKPADSLMSLQAPDVDTRSADSAPATATATAATAAPVPVPAAGLERDESAAESLVLTQPWAVASGRSVVLAVSGLTKRFDDTLAVAGIDLEVSVGDFYGIVGPNGAGKTTTLSMITGLLRPDSGTVVVHGADVWSDPAMAKRTMGVLPDRLRLFDRLTGAQLLYYSGILRGLDAAVVRQRSADLAQAFGLDEAMGRLVTDYSAGMAKKVALAAAMIHSPRLLVLDEPFESIDPVSAATVTGILKKYAAAGGTVVLSSHSMDLVQRICDHVAVIVNGEILADGTMDEVRDGAKLEDRFVELAGGMTTTEGLPWLNSFSD